MLTVKFDPATRVLEMTSERTKPFKEVIQYDEWYDLFSHEDEYLITVMVENQGNQMFEFFFEGMSEDDPDRPEDYDVADLIHMQSISVKSSKCPVCNSKDIRDDHDNPESMTNCNKCGSEWTKVDGEITLDARDYYTEEENKKLRRNQK